MTSKFALVIANTEYQDEGLAKLTAPGKDAAGFAHVLQQPDLAGFDVEVLLNESEAKTRRAIARFFTDRKPDDLLLLYFSGHGVRNDQGQLFLAAKDTEIKILDGTGIPAEFITRSMNNSRSRRQVLILDCCNSGAFDKGTKSFSKMGISEAFEGNGFGRIVLTATDAIQFAWEGEKVIGNTQNSIFTHFLIEGLNGAADLNGDGKITVDELYNYAYERVVNSTSKQTPGKWSYKQQGDIFLRENLPLDPSKQSKSTEARSPEEKLLEEGLSNWRKQKLLLGPDTMKVIESQKASLTITPESASLILLSATSQSDVIKWVEAFPDTLRKDTVTFLLSLKLEDSEKANKKIDAVLWALKRYLPEQVKTGFILKHFLKYKAPSYMAAFLIMSAAVWAVYGLLNSYTAVNTKGWKKITNYSTTCDLVKPGNVPLLSTDLLNPSRVYLHLAGQSNSVCFSTDFGKSWTTYKLGMPKNANILEFMAADDTTFLITPNAIYKGNSFSFSELGLPEKTTRTVLRDFAINPNQAKEYFLLAGENQVFMYSPDKWTQLQADEIYGTAIAIATDGFYLAIVTNENVWTQEIGQSSWSKIALSEGLKPIALAMPPKSLGQFYIVTFDNRIFTGVSQKTSQLTEIKWPKAVSLTFAENITYLGGVDSIYCKGNWNIFTSEWWRMKIEKYPPCY